jgi:hypothetical protein
VVLIFGSPKNFSFVFSFKLWDSSGFITDNLSSAFALLFFDDLTDLLEAFFSCFVT